MPSHELFRGIHTKRLSVVSRLVKLPKHNFECCVKADEFAPVPYPSMTQIAPVQSAVDVNVLKTQFADPAREFGFMPLWCWNDDLTDEGLIEQIGEFYAKGFGGFIIHPRNGLSRRVGYLTEEFFRLVKVSVAEADRLGMKVILYDEAGYPAGSARGAVVAENPDWAARSIFAMHENVTGKGIWRPNPGRALGYRLVKVIAGLETTKDTLDPETLRCLEWDEHELVRYDLPEGNWRLVAVWEGHSGGTTRGAFEEEEDEHSLAPPAADIMRADAMEFFIRITHDEYYGHLKEYFGNTVVAMFTDEPSPRGRMSAPGHRGPQVAWTPGFLPEVQDWWDDDVGRWLPALWLDCGPRTEEFRGVYNKAVQLRLQETFYGPISRWCRDHNIALTGHAANSDEMSNLRTFQWPGQDIVWRQIEAGKDTAFTGPDSLTAKGASSAARLGHRRFNVVEVFGAYGWELNLDEIKWLLDWHFVRGTNLIYPHAAFYTIRGRRAFESQPDVAVNNVWWPYFGLIGDYGRRLCWLLCDGEEVCETAVVSDGDLLSWKASAVLQRKQQDFIFIDGPGLESATVEDGVLSAGEQRLKLLIIDQPGTLGAKAEARIGEFEAGGGLVLRDWTDENLAEQVSDIVGRDVEWQGNHGEDLRSIRYRKGGVDFYLLVNEGEATLDGYVCLGAMGALERWNALDGTTQDCPAEAADDGRLKVALRLDRRESVVLAVDTRVPLGSDVAAPKNPGDLIMTLDGPWEAVDQDGKSAEFPALGDWAQAKGWETFTGTLGYRTNFEVSEEALPRFIDLGAVGDIAEVLINGKRVGVQAWAPYVLPLAEACHSGTNRLEVRVTNSMANSYDGRQLPSGLMGPVTLRNSR